MKNKYTKVLSYIGMMLGMAGTASAQFMAGDFTRTTVSSAINGDGSFWESQMVLRKGDFNKDGKMDILTTGFSGYGTFYIHLNNSTTGGLIFSPTSSLPGFTGSGQFDTQHYQIIDASDAGDLNGDGGDDVVCLGYRNQSPYFDYVVTTRFSNMAPGFTGTPTEAAVCFQPASAISLSNSVLPNFTATNGKNSNQLRIVDLDGDGKKDIVVATLNTPPNGWTPGTGIINLVIIRNITTNNSTSFVGEAPINISISCSGLNYARINHLSVGDVNGDGKMDLVAGGEGIGIATGRPGSLLINTSAAVGSFSFDNNPNNTGLQGFGNVGPDYSPNGPWPGVNNSWGSQSKASFGSAIGDMNNDGKNDVVINIADNVMYPLIFRQVPTTSGISFISDNGTIPQNTAGAQLLGTDVADLDGDQQIDFLSATDGSNVRLFKGNHTAGGALTFSTGFNYSAPGSTNTNKVVVADFNLDGKPDFVTFGSSASVGSLAFFTNNIAYPMLSVVGINPVGISVNSVITLTGQSFDYVKSVNFPGSVSGIVSVTNFKFKNGVPSDLYSDKLLVTVPANIACTGTLTITGNMGSTTIAYSSGATGSQTITLPVISSSTVYSTTPYVISGISASSGKVVSLSIAGPNSAMITSTSVGMATVTGFQAGTYTVTGNQAGGALGCTVFNAASATTTTFTISKASQTVAIAALTNLTMSSGLMTTVTVTSLPISGNPVRIYLTSISGGAILSSVTTSGNTASLSIPSNGSFAMFASVDMGTNHNSVTVTGYGSYFVASAPVLAYTVSMPSISTQTLTGASGLVTATLTGAQTAITYSVMSSPAGIATVGASTGVITYTAIGTVTVTGTTATTSSFTISKSASTSFAVVTVSGTSTTSLNFSEADTKLSVYPNPSTGKFTISTPGKFSYTIVSSTGTVVAQGSGLDVQGVEISVAKGSYILVVSSTLGKASRKILIQ